MLIRHCFKCDYHKIEELDGTSYSHCAKENCFCLNSDCIAVTALDYFLDDKFDKMVLELVQTKERTTLAEAVCVAIVTYFKSMEDFDSDLPELLYRWKEIERTYNCWEKYITTKVEK
jgi:hypothetical protein